MLIHLTFKRTTMNKIFAIFLLSALCSCSGKQDTKMNEAVAKEDSVPKSTENVVYLTDAQIKNAGIEIGNPEIKTIESTLRVNGLIDVPPQNMVTISFPSGGYLKSTNMIPGMKITKGQVLAVMQDPSFIQMQEDYLMAKAKVGFLEREYERQKLLNQTKATSDKVYQQTETDYLQARITVKALSAKLMLIGIYPSGLNENTIRHTVNIYSPISGFVSDVKVNIGKYVSATDVLFELVNTNDLHLALAVFEKDLPSIHPGQIVKAYLTSDTTNIYNARVMLVGRTLDSNRSAMVHCHFTGALPKLLPGMFMNADIQITNNSAIAVPEEAVVRSGDKDYIFIETKPKQFAFTPVSTLATKNGFIAINSPVKDLVNKVIIKKNAYVALMKMKNTGDEE
jgi:cobalt-zinc-cadmium efflux system membrane fusion protein